MKSKIIQLKLLGMLMVSCLMALVTKAQISPGSAVKSGPDGRIVRMLDQVHSPANTTDGKKQRVEQFETEKEEDHIGAELYTQPNPMHATAKVKYIDPARDVVSPPTRNDLQSKVTSQHPGYVGLGNLPNGLDPSDAQIAAGPNHIVVLANADARILNKVTGAVISQMTLAAFFQWSGFVFDPRIMYDPYGGHWVALALQNANSGCAAASVDSKFRVLISNNSDPTQGWFYYEFDVDGANQTWMDFAKLGFNRDWICVSGNVRCGSNPTGLYVLPRTASESAGSITYHYWNSIELGNPAFTYDMSLDRLYIVRTGNSNNGGTGYCDSWYIDATPNLNTGFSYGTSPWQAFANSTNAYPKQSGGPAFSAVNTFGHAIFNNAVYRNGLLWFTHAIFLPATGTTNRVSTQWWSVNPANGAISQVGRIDDGSGATSEYYMSIGVNNQSDAVVTYSWFNGSYHPSAAYNYRNAGDATNLLPQGTVYYNGTTSDADGRGGDYSQCAVDPLDDQSFWVVNQVPDWSTRFALIPGYFGCYTDATFGNNNWSGYAKNEASGSITSAEMIQSPSVVDYDAGTRIILTSGFRANEGSHFRAYIEGCGGFSPNPAKPAKSEPIVMQAEDANTKTGVVLFPNPASGLFNIQYRMKKESEVNIAVFSADMKKVAQSTHGKRPSGPYTDVFDASAWAPGLYFIKLQMGGDVKTLQVVVTHK